MFRFPDDARAVPGRAIRPAWEALEQGVDDFNPPLGGPHVRISEYPDGTEYFYTRPDPGLSHPFQSLVSGTGASVAPGLVNLEMPRMGKENLTLDGLDEEGKETGRFPELELLAHEYGGPGAGGSRSFICLRVVLDPELGAPAMERKPLTWLTIVHRPRLPEGFYAGGMPSAFEDDEEVGLWPVAICYWNEDATFVLRYFPAVLHNIQYRFQPGGLVDEESEETGPNRHWFFGAT